MVSYVNNPHLLAIQHSTSTLSSPRMGEISEAEQQEQQQYLLNCMVHQQLPQEKEYQRQLRIMQNQRQLQWDQQQQQQLLQQQYQQQQQQQQQQQEQRQPYRLATHQNMNDHDNHNNNANNNNNNTPPLLNQQDPGIPKFIIFVSKNHHEKYHHHQYDCQRQDPNDSSFEKDCLPSFETPCPSLLEMKSRNISYRTISKSQLEIV
jgi:hypothetical protein